MNKCRCVVRIVKKQRTEKKTLEAPFGREKKIKRTASEQQRGGHDVQRPEKTPSLPRLSLELTKQIGVFPAVLCIVHLLWCDIHTTCAKRHSIFSLFPYYFVFIFACF
jgi:hypothetical protein